VANAGTGVYIHDKGTNNNRVVGNFIGTDAAGDEGLGNTNQGIDIGIGASNNVVTGGNVIGCNGGTGIYIHDAGTTGNTVSSNFIGTDSTRTLQLGNRLQGVDIRNGANGNTIGGTSSSAGNTIAFNGDYGVLVIGANQDRILSNNIFGNITNGIGEFTNGNNMQAPPTLNSATVSGATTTLTGSLPQANTSVLLQIFKNTPNGQVLVFSGFVKTDAKGNFTLTLTGLVSGDSLTATATIGNNTSVFAAALLVK
jgi:hypothetical protein